MQDIGSNMGSILLLLIPVVLIELGLKAFALLDLLRRERAKGLPKWGWALVILLVNLFGPIAYLVLGREE